MVETADIIVQINKNSDCIHKSSSKFEKNDLKSMISHLSSIQKQVNEVLTKLVESEKSLISDSNADNESGEEDLDDEDDSDDGHSKSKKCKFK